MPALLGLGLLSLSVAGCIGFTDATDGTGGGGTTGDVTDPSSPDAGGDALPDQTPDQPDADANDVLGHVAEVYCDDVIAIDDIPVADQTGVFQSASSPGDFSSWLSDDEVSFDAATSRLTNRNRDLELTVTLLGTRFGSAQIVNLATNRTTITLADGSFWIISTLDGNEALDWAGGDAVVIVQPADPTDTWRLLNLRRCESIRVERIS
ncbi:MAG TPA: hypothetical protein VM487_23600 [Phycisphaerae bacterium]|nr:hypothetical protein [Phycisphaerae bacterium]